MTPIEQLTKPVQVETPAQQPSVEEVPHVVREAEEVALLTQCGPGSYIYRGRIISQVPPLPNLKDMGGRVGFYYVKTIVNSQVTYVTE